MFLWFHGFKVVGNFTLGEIVDYLVFTPDLKIFAVGDIGSPSIFPCVSMQVELGFLSEMFLDGVLGLVVSWRYFNSRVCGTCMSDKEFGWVVLAGWLRATAMLLRDS